MILLMAAAAAVASPDAVIGRWQTEARHGLVEITRCGPSICGRLLTSDGLRANPDMRDSKNKDATLRTRRLAGIQLIGGFTRDADAWTSGTVYNPYDGGTYKATVTPIDADHLSLKGCWSFFCQSQTWTRIR